MSLIFLSFWVGNGLNFLSIKVPMVTTETGLQYKDIKVGEGPSPPVGFQVRRFTHIFTFLFSSYVLRT